MNAARLAALVLTGACVAPEASAQADVAVYSAFADSVSVTVYPDNLALITETRTVNLPDSAATLVIQDVVDTLLPQSAVVAGLDRPLAESNFDFNRLTPDSLLENAVGSRITLMRTNPATGVVSYVPATVLSTGDHVVLETEDGKEVMHCSGLSEGIVFDRLPDDLYAEPQLSVQLAAGAGGERTFEVSYLAHGFTWTADYVAHLDGGGERMDLAGWATVTNGSSQALKQVEVQLVAGRLNILSGIEGGSRAVVDRSRLDEAQREARLRLAALNTPAEFALAESALRVECFATPTPEALRSAERMFETATGGASATYGADSMISVAEFLLTLEAFGDYHLYRLPWRTDLGARQTKQLLFVDLRDAAIERIYRLDVFDLDGDTRSRLELIGDASADSNTALIPPRLLLRTSNTAAAGLGEPLPAGIARIFETSDFSTIFLGEALVQNLPVGAELELAIGRALDILVRYQRQFEEGNRHRIEAEVLVYNDKNLPIDFELRHSVDPDDYVDIDIERSSRQFQSDGDNFFWRFEIPPGDTALSYVLSASEID